MTALSIYLFGSVRVFRNGGQPVPLRPSAKSMLAYLLIHQPHPANSPGHRRETLVNRFWGDNDEQLARRCLSTTLWRLRQGLEPKGTPRGTYLTAPSGGEVGFNFDSDHWLDVVAFERQIQGVMARPADQMTPADAEAMEAAHRLFTGELLEDCYDDWVFRERERLNLIYLSSLDRLMSYYEGQNAVEEGLTCGHKILAIDPLREQVHRRIMRLYRQGGQRTMAIHQYNICRNTLADELGIAPMPETQALYQRILSSSDARTSELPLEPAQPPQTLQQALKQLALAMSSLEKAQEQLHQAQQVVSRFTDLGHLESAD